MVLCGVVSIEDFLCFLIEVFVNLDFLKCFYVMMFYVFRVFVFVGDEVYELIWVYVWDFW